VHDRIKVYITITIVIIIIILYTLYNDSPHY